MQHPFSKPPHLPAAKGFTLLELSIVLMVIGLIVGTLVGSQALITQAKLQKVITEFSNFRVAFDNFTLKYQTMPGDFQEADVYWPGNRCAGFSCNGNNNNIMDDSIESLQAWKHMELAHMLTGPFAGGEVDESPARYMLNNTAIFGNIPASVWDKAVGGQGTGYVFINEDCNIWDPFTYELHTMISVVTPPTSGNSCNSGDGIFTPEEVRRIDQKIDDGAFNTGRYIGSSTVADRCFDKNLPHNYRVGSTERICSISALLQFN